MPAPGRGRPHHYRKLDAVQVLLTGHQRASRRTACAVSLAPWVDIRLPEPCCWPDSG
ncbi:hypothetical protein ACWGCW_05825 [Streptomyces sp. NPDC054933]